MPAALLACVAEDLAGVELFDGEGQWRAGMADAGFQFEGFDISNDPQQDLSTNSGLLIFLAMLVRIQGKGILNIALPCKCWVWLSRGRHGRSKHVPAGRHEARPKWVQDNNELATTVAYIIVTAVAFGIHILIENPKTSVVWWFPAIHDALLRVNASRVCISMASFNGESQKHLILKSTLPWVEDLAWISKSMPKKHATKRHLCTIYEKDGIHKVKGESM